MYDYMNCFVGDEWHESTTDSPFSKMVCEMNTGVSALSLSVHELRRYVWFFAIS